MNYSYLSLQKKSTERMIDFWEKMDDYYDYQHDGYPWLFYAFFQNYGRDSAVISKTDNYVLIITKDTIKPLWLEYLGILLDSTFNGEYFILKVQRFSFNQNKKYNKYLPILEEKQARRRYSDHTYIWDFVDKHLSHLKGKLHYDFCRWNFVKIDGFWINLDPFLL